MFTFDWPRRQAQWRLGRAPRAACHRPRRPILDL